MLIADEIYDRIIFEGHEFHSILEVAPTLESAVLLNGFSKSYAMAGWRLGYMFGPKELMDAALIFQQNSITCPSTFAQYGALSALSEGEPFISQALEVYQAHKELCIEGFRKIPAFEVVEPEGGLYVFLGHSRVEPNSEKFALDVLEELNIAVTPGSAFGTRGEGYVRMCIATDKENLVECISRLTKRYRVYWHK